MELVSVRIVRFVDASQPGFVACELVDACGRCHTFVDKVPIFTSEDLDAESPYPQPGSIACRILKRWQDSGGRSLARISTEEPWNVASTEDACEFVVLADQLDVLPES